MSDAPIREWVPEPEAPPEADAPPEPEAPPEADAPPEPQPERGYADEDLSTWTREELLAEEKRILQELAEMTAAEMVRAARAPSSDGCCACRPRPRHPLE